MSTIDNANYSIVAIIPLYNGAGWIEGAIRSVFAQTLQPDEFIVVDDGSTDGGAGAAIVERLAKERPITLLRKDNGGQSSARNFGVARSKSALIALLDQDDRWYPNHLKLLRRPFLNKNAPGLIGWVYSDLDRYNRNEKLFCKSLLGTMTITHPKRHIYDCLREDMFILPSASLILRTAFERVGGFDERLCGYEDDDLFLRIFLLGYDNVFINMALSAWTIHSTSTSYTARMTKSRLVYAEKLFKMFPDDRGQRIFYARDLIAPRFIRNSLLDSLFALWAKDKERVRRNLSTLPSLICHRPLQDRIIVRLIAAIFRSGRLGESLIEFILYLRRKGIALRYI